MASSLSSSSPLFSTKSPCVKRILKEAVEFESNPSLEYHAQPLEENIYEWHFTLTGAPAPSPFANGLYHGRITLPSNYPLAPPTFRFLTPSGRFETNRPICLSISGHHEETWQPAWGMRTALVALRSFMDTDAMGQVGGIESGPDLKREFAKISGDWTCGACCGGMSNAMIMNEHAKVMAETKPETVEEEGSPVDDSLLVPAAPISLLESSPSLPPPPTAAPVPSPLLTRPAPLPIPSPTLYLDILIHIFAGLAIIWALKIIASYL